MIRKIIHIDEEKCNGCGLCATACHEGAIDIINGKAKLVRENFCDGFGDCLPGCPTGAITFEEREAPAYDEAAVQENKKKKELQEKMKHLHDVRGTFCTLLLTECDLTDKEAADILAWSPERVGNIRKVYVDHAQVVVALGERIGAKQKAKHSGVT